MLSKVSNYSCPSLPPPSPSPSVPSAKAPPETQRSSTQPLAGPSTDGFDSSPQGLSGLLSRTAQLLGQVTQLLGSELGALTGQGLEVPELGEPEKSPTAPASAAPATPATQPSQTEAVQSTSGVQGDYGVKQAVADLEKLSQNHQLSGENRGLGDAHRPEFDQNKQAIATAAIAAAQRYFPELSVKDGTRLILSDAALESTFNPKLNAESGPVDPDKTVGLLQARGASNLADFKKFASAEDLKHADGSAWDPKSTPTDDLAKIWENIHVGAWYISTTARLGATSPNEHFDMGRQGPRSSDVTTGLLSHLMGPGGAASDPHNQNPGGSRYLRIVGGELDSLDPGTSQRILGARLAPQRVL